MKKNQFVIAKCQLTKEVSEGMYMYGEALYRGHGINSDKREAVGYYMMAADKGNTDGMTKYAESLFFSYKKYDFQKSNLNESACYFKISVDKESIEGINKYIIALENGYCVEVNKKEETRYCKMEIDLNVVLNLW